MDGSKIKDPCQAGAALAFAPLASGVGGEGGLWLVRTSSGTSYSFLHPSILQSRPPFHSTLSIHFTLSTSQTTTSRAEPHPEPENGIVDTYSKGCPVYLFFFPHLLQSFSIFPTASLSSVGEKGARLSTVKRDALTRPHQVSFFLSPRLPLPRSNDEYNLRLILLDGALAGVSYILWIYDIQFLTYSDSRPGYLLSLRTAYPESFG